MSRIDMKQDLSFRKRGQVRAPRYVLITPAYNEAAHIEKTIQSVIAQSILPLKWIVVSDGSTDETDDIVARYTPLWSFIQLLRVEKRHGHSFASKVVAFNRGLELLQNTTFDFIGNLDADVSFGPKYFADLFEKFDQDSTLGVAGGGIYEWDGSAYRARKGNTTSDVAGAVQLFRRQCWDAVGGFLPLRYGGEDWCTQLTARMNKWRVRCFFELEVRHHRPAGKTAGLRYWTRQGMMDYDLGSHPVIELGRLLRRIHHYPPVLGATARLCGFLAGYWRREKRTVSIEVVRFLRSEEGAKLRQTFAKALGRVSPRRRTRRSSEVTEKGGQ
jgi:poly-beta-1,6-N-acetyl-D-glucosamine synthase